MQTTLNLLEKALEKHPATYWTERLKLNRTSLYVARHRGGLSPAIAGVLAEELGEPVEKWIVIAALESERDSACKERLLKRQWGFTLIEILVVLAIVAIAIAGVARALPDAAERELAAEGDRLAAILTAARGQARAAGTSIVLEFESATPGLSANANLGPNGTFSPSGFGLRALPVAAWVHALAVPQVGENVGIAEQFSTLAAEALSPALSRAQNAAANTSANAHDTTLVNTANHWTGGDMPDIAAHASGVWLRWLHADTRVRVASPITLAPQPVGQAQTIVLAHASAPLEVVVSSDGAAPFVASGVLRDAPQQR